MKHFNVLLLLILIFNFSCNEDYNAVGVDLVSTSDFKTITEYFPVYSKTDSIADLQSDRQVYMHIGEFTLPFFGRNSANFTTQINIPPSSIFGNFSQSREDAGDPNNTKVIEENERVKDVFLEIPFIVDQRDSDNDGVIDPFDIDPNDPNSDSDGDGVTDIEERSNGTNPLDSDSDGDGISDLTDTDNSSYDSENKVYSVDSIYGNKSTQFNFKVTELTYFFNDLDPDDNFESIKPYYSQRDYYEEGFVGRVLADYPYQLDFNELRYNYKEDDPETESVNETELVETRLTPRIRIPLDNSFFQEKILDMEGTDALENANNFHNHIKSINFRISNSNEDIYMLLNMTGASIKVNYNFDLVNDNGTQNILTDDTIEEGERILELPIGGVKINHFKNHIATENNLSSGKIYLKGGLGTRSIINIFDKAGESEVIEELRKKNNILVNEASLILYVDPLFTQNWNSESLIAERLYIYKTTDNLPLSDYFSDPTSSQTDPTQNKIIHGGKLEYKNNKPYRYKIKITEHVTDLINLNDGVYSQNIPLSLVVTSDVSFIRSRKAILKNGVNKISIPEGSIYNPLGTVILNETPPEGLNEKKLVLELKYTEF